ncbi:hypothetical protein OXX59_009176 [Metschnikowia pulcherrima]
MFFIDEGAYASVVFEKDYNDALDVDGDFSDEEPEAWDDFDDEKLAVSVMLRARYEKIYPRPDLADEWNSNHDNDKEY